MEVCLGDIDGNCDKDIFGAGEHGINSDQSMTGISISSWLVSIYRSSTTILFGGDLLKAGPTKAGLPAPLFLLPNLTAHNLGSIEKFSLSMFRAMECLSKSPLIPILQS